MIPLLATHSLSKSFGHVTAVHGVSLAGGVLYSTTQPCTLCSKMLINAQIQKIVFQGAYPDELSLSLLKEAGIELVLWAKE